MRFVSKKIRYAEDHISRMWESVHTIFPGSESVVDMLYEWCFQVVDSFRSQHGMIRLAVYASEASVTAGRYCGSIMIKEFNGHADVIYRKGVRLRCSRYLKSKQEASFPQVKANNYLPAVLDMLSSADTTFQGVIHDCIFINQRGYVSEGSVSNLFAVQNGVIVTPCISSGVLPGVIRGQVASICFENGIPFKETHITRHEIYNAQEVFLTNSSSGAVPVVEVDGRMIGDGKPGKFSRLLNSEMKRQLEMEE